MQVNLKFEVEELKKRNAVLEHDNQLMKNLLHQALKNGFLLTSAARTKLRRTISRLIEK